jgi:predicted aspartyl protease
VKFRFSLWIVLSLALLSPSIVPSSPRADSAGKQSVRATARAQKALAAVQPVLPGGELPFRLSHGYLIVVEGQIGTQSNLKFILDTGATMSIVDTKIADKLRLPQQHPMESFNFDRKLAWEQATIPEIQFGPVKASNTLVLVGHLADYSEFAQNVDAIIGLDLLKLSNFGIDYVAKKIIFDSPKPGARAPHDAALSNGLVFEAQIQGHPVRLIVDTGFPGILLFEERVRATVPELRLIGKVSDVTIGGRLHARKATLSGVVIGPLHMDVSVFLTKGPAAELLPGVTGVLGIAELNARRINFDFVKGTLSWE